MIQRATVAEARDEAADATNAMVAALRDVGVPGADIQTSTAPPGPLGGHYLQELQLGGARPCVDIPA